MQEARTTRCVVRVAPRKDSLLERAYVRVEDMTVAVICDSRPDRISPEAPPLDRSFRHYSSRFYRGQVEWGGTDPAIVRASREIDVRRYRKLHCLLHGEPQLVSYVRPKPDRVGGLVCMKCREEGRYSLPSRSEDYTMEFHGSKRPNTKYVRKLLESKRCVDADLFPDVAAMIMEMEQHLDDQPGGIWFPRVVIVDPSTTTFEHNTEWVERFALGVMRGDEQLDVQLSIDGIEKVTIDEDGGYIKYETADDAYEVPVIPGFRLNIRAGGKLPSGRLVQLPETGFQNYPDLDAARNENADAVDAIIDQIKNEAVVEVGPRLRGTDIRMLKRVPHNALAYCQPVKTTYALLNEFLVGQAGPVRWNLRGVPSQWTSTQHGASHRKVKASAQAQGSGPATGSKAIAHEPSRTNDAFPVQGTEDIQPVIDPRARELGLEHRSGVVPLEAVTAEEESLADSSTLAVAAVGSDTNGEGTT